METVEISADEYKELVKCQARLEILRGIIKLSDSEYMTRSTLALVAGTDEKNERRD